MKHFLRDSTSAPPNDDPARSPIDVLLGGPKVDGGLQTTRDNPFMTLCGMLTKDARDELDKAIDDQRRIDPEMWN